MSHEEPILGAVFGGVLIGIGSGITLRIGGSSGGFDIVGLILTRKFDFPLGTLLSIHERCCHCCTSAISSKIGTLLFTRCFAIYISGKVVDSIHIRHVKVTAFIVTKQKEVSCLTNCFMLPRGVTLVKTEGAYTKQQHDMLMTVTTRYELVELKRIIKKIDPKALVNIVETVGVVGEFRKLK